MLARAWLELKKKHEEDVNNFPIAYAFSEEQLQQALEKLGATKGECVSVLGIGDIVKKSDAHRLIALFKQHNKEIQEFLLRDEREVEEAFLYEMDNHEYAINYSGDEDVMSCFNVNHDKLDEMGLRNAYLSARRKHMEHAKEWM